MKKKNSTLNFGEDRCYLPRGFRKILLMYFNMKVRKKQMNEKDKQLEEFKLIAQAVIPAINCIKNTLENHKIDSLLSLTMSADGYLTMNIHEIERTL